MARWRSAPTLELMGQRREVNRDVQRTQQGDTRDGVEIGEEEMICIASTCKTQKKWSEPAGNRRSVRAGRHGKRDGVWLAVAHA
jgi:hypothetical protein